MSESNFAKELEQQSLTKAWEQYMVDLANSKELAEAPGLKEVVLKIGKDPSTIDRLTKDMADRYKKRFFQHIADTAKPKKERNKERAEAAKQDQEENPLRLKVKAAIEQYREQGNVVHPVLEKAIRNLAAGRNVYLHGPAGSGKSVTARQMAEVMSLFLEEDIEFFDMVAGPNFSEFDFLAKAMPVAEKGKTGLRVIRSPYMQAFAKGNALAFIDEQDVAPSEANLSLNGGLEQRRQFDPSIGVTVAAGKHFYYVSAGNTNLEGPTPNYPARQPQDSAFISRFVGSRLYVDYSEEVEKLLLNDRVLEFLTSLRKTATQKGVNVEISTRLGVNMTKKIDSGLFTFDEVVKDWAVELPSNAVKTLGIEKLV